MLCALVRQVFVSQQLLLFLREAELVLYILRQGAILRVYHIERRLEILPAHANHDSHWDRYWGMTAYDSGSVPTAIDGFFV